MTILIHELMREAAERLRDAEATDDIKYSLRALMGNRTSKDAYCVLYIRATLEFVLSLHGAPITGRSPSVQNQLEVTADLLEILSYVFAVLPLLETHEQVRAYIADFAKWSLTQKEPPNAPLP